MSTSVAMSTLAKAAQINPPLNAKLPLDEPVSFVPMAAVSAETARVEASMARPYSEVSKGYTAFLSGDILFAKITPCFENGKIAQALLPLRYGFGSTEFHVIRPVPGVSDGRYLHHFLRLERVRSEGQRRMTGSGGQRRVPANYLAELAIPLPPLPEQRRISAILDQADILRTQRRAALSQLDNLTQSLFLDMFGDIETNEHSWAHAELQQVVKPGTIVTYGIVQAGDEYPGGVPYIRTGDLVNGQVLADGLRHTDPAIAAKFSRSRVETDDIVMSIRATVGTTALVPPALNGANLTQGTARIAPGPKTDATYLLHFLRESSTQNWISRQVKGATFREITLGRLRELPVYIPPLPLQQSFATRVQAIEALKAQHRAALAEADALFAALQQRAFAGVL